MMPCRKGTLGAFHKPEVLISVTGDDCRRIACVINHFSSVQLFATPWTIVSQAPLSMSFSRQEYWSGLPFPPPRDLPNPGIEPVSLRPPALAGRFFTTVSPGKPRQSLACMHAKLLQSYLTLCDSMDSSLPGSSVHGLL